MNSRSYKIKDSLSGVLKQKKDIGTRFIAQVGDGNNNVDVSGSPNMIYIRRDGRVGVVHNDKVDPKNDTWVVVEKPKSGGIEKVIEVYSSKKSYEGITKNGLQ